MGQLVWIASYPESGNTWVWPSCTTTSASPDAPYDINRLTDLAAADINAERYHRYDLRPASQYTVADVQRMRRLVHRDPTALDPRLVFVKTHNGKLVTEGALLITPEVTAGAHLYIVRDPRDVAVSYSRHLGCSIDDTIAFMADPDAASDRRHRRQGLRATEFLVRACAILDESSRPSGARCAPWRHGRCAGRDIRSGFSDKLAGAGCWAGTAAAGDPVQHVRRTARARASQGLQGACGGIRPRRSS